MSDRVSQRFLHVIDALPQTEACLEKVPPDLAIATGHDDEVMLFVVRVGDPLATVEMLLPIITLEESSFVLDSFARTNGLIQKRLSVETAQRLRTSLLEVGTVVEFVRPADT